MKTISRPLRLLIVGGSGFLSGTLARIAVASGHEVTAITRGQRALPPGVRPIIADRHDHPAFSRRIGDLGETWDLVVDSIAYSPADAVQDISVFGGRAGQLVFISTDFIYDPRLRENPQGESAPAYAASGYGGLKRQAEIALQQTPTTALAWTILRPSHIYGPGSLPGCLPLHGRDPQLVEHILARRPLRLVAGGRYLQHPVFAPDLARTILSVPESPKAIGGTFNVAGPDVFESRHYYHLLGEILGRDVRIDEVAPDDFLAAHPDKAPFCCDRVYDLSAIRAAGATLPDTPFEAGLRSQVESGGL